MKLWIGKEREGKLKGTETLFVGDLNITIADITEVIKYQKFKQIYFGAGVCSKINYKVVRSAITLFKEYIITLEVDYKEFNNVPIDIIDSNVNFIITITDKGFSKLNKIYKDRIQIKIQSLEKEKYLLITELIKFDIVDVSILRKKTYKGDKVVK